MGLLLGKVDGNNMIVMDSFALPVEGTETRVNAQAQAYEYMAAYIDAAKQVQLWSAVDICCCSCLCILYVGVVLIFQHKFKMLIVSLL